MSPLADRPFLHRSVGAFVASVGMVLLALVASAAIQPRVDNPHGKFKGECQLCHSAKGWKIVKISSKFDHAKYAFPLTGAHATANCMGCHTSLNFAQSKTQCASCHQDPHRGEMGTDCAHCHGARSFQDRGPMVRAHQLSRFPLTGSHATLECESCHKPVAQGQMQFVGTSAECYSCHKPQYETAPNHKSSGYSTQCQTCHTPISWTNADGFDHAAAGFALTGGHVQPCENCHHGVFTNTSKDCYSCHATTYAGATPTHNPTSFPTATANCIGCHAQANANHITWAGANNFDHTAAGFPLTGNHSTNVRQCDDCHHGNFTTTSRDCASCHTTTTPGYNNPGPGAPVHTATYFPTAQCATCHASAAATHTSWQGGVYTHSQMQMTNAHAGHLCEDCHKGNYTSVAYNCYGCHQNSTPGYANAVNPVHTPASFPTTNAACTGCHNTVAWRPASFTHPASFALSNAHSGRLCEDCHKGNYTSLVNNCYACHQNSSPGYASAQPPHTPANFKTDNGACTSCHNTTLFSPSTFPANHSTTAFAAYFSGAHRALACTDCHNAATWNVPATGNNCYGCHAADYAATTNPHHDTVNYPTAGCMCHSLTAWSPATGHDHTAAGFPLTGNHALGARVCNDCHAASGYGVGATSKDCYSCHTTDYASNPVLKHTTPNFPTTTAQCVTCHAAANSSHVTWQGGVFTNHAGVTTSFALSGNHGGMQCSDCHTSAATDLLQYTCAVSCHTGSNGFNGHGNKSCSGTTFSAARATGTMKACYTCHPRGTSNSPC